jgi:hypothetical protein
MANYATVENNIVTGVYDLLPANWKHISGLDKLENEIETLNSLGWYKVTKPVVPYDSATQYIKTYEWQFIDGEVQEIPVFDDIIPEDPALTELKFNSALYEMRKIRDQLLSECDWTELPSVQALRDDEWKQKWINYRQLLRDYPNKWISGELNIWSFVWPSKP